MDGAVLGASFAAAAAVLVYANTLPAGFAFDDSFAVIYNGDVTQDNNPLTGLLQHDFWGQRIASEQSHKSYRPLTVLLLRLIRQAWEALPYAEAVQAWRASTGQAPIGGRDDRPSPPPLLDPLPFHLVNVVLHAVASALVCLLAYHLFQVRAQLVHCERAVAGTATVRTCSSPTPTQSGPTRGHLAVSSATSPTQEDRGQHLQSRTALENRWSPLDVLTVHLPSWLTAIAFALHPVHTEAVAGIVGIAETLCAVLSLSALLLYYKAADMDLLTLGEGPYHTTSSSTECSVSPVQSKGPQKPAEQPRKQQDNTSEGRHAATGRSTSSSSTIKTSVPSEHLKDLRSAASTAGSGSIFHHWCHVLLALLLTFAAALSKEIGITVVGAMLAYDILLIPPVSNAGHTCVTGNRQEDGTHPCTSGKATPQHQGSVAKAARLLVCQRKVWRMVLCVAVALGYVRLRSWVAVDQLVRIYRKVENPLAFTPSLLSRLLSTAHLHARYAWLLLWPRTLSCDWSYACIPLVERFQDPRNLGSCALYGVLLWLLVAARPWGVLTAWVRVFSTDARGGLGHLHQAGSPGTEQQMSDSTKQIPEQQTRKSITEQQTYASNQQAQEQSTRKTSSQQKQKQGQQQQQHQRSNSRSPGDPTSQHHLGTASSQTQGPTAGPGVLTPDLLPVAGAPALAWAPAAAGRWRLMVASGLLVGPFFPASNVLFFVGTFIGERLLYMPSLGFLLLVSELTCASLLPQLLVPRASPLTNQQALGAGHRSAKQERRHAVARKRALGVLLLLALALGLAGYAARTWTRNWDWLTEDRLFLAAQEVCPNSAKVQLNSGILARRSGNMTAALSHFQRAREIEPGYCDPGYWIGVCQLNLGDVQAALQELEAALDCKYVAAEALTALNRIYQAMRGLSPDQGLPLARWGRILTLPQVGRPGEGCEALEAGALLWALHQRDLGGVLTALDTCQKALEAVVTASGSNKGQSTASIASDQSQLLVRSPDGVLAVHAPEQLLECLAARRPVYIAIAQHGPQSPYARLAMYSYLKWMAEGGAGHCRGLVGPGTIQGGERNPPHMALVHSMQARDAEDAWLQQEWGLVLSHFPDRLEEAITHLHVAGMLFTNQLALIAQRQPPTLMDLEGRPLSPYKALRGIASAYTAAGQLCLHALQHAEAPGTTAGQAGLRPTTITRRQTCDMLFRAAEAHIKALPSAPGPAAGKSHLVELDRVVHALQAQAKLPDDPSGAPALLSCDQYLTHVQTLKQRSKLP